MKKPMMSLPTALRRIKRLEAQIKYLIEDRSFWYCAAWELKHQQLFGNRKRGKR